MDEAIYHLNNWLHAGLGFIALAGAVVALHAAKGSRRHRLGGWVFVGLMLPVVLTTLLMMFHEFLPLAVVLATAEVYLVPAALLSVNRSVKGFAAWSMMLAGLVALLFLFVLVQFIRISLAADQIFVGPLVLATMFGFLLFQDLHMLRTRPETPSYWVRRHLVRMILAFTIGVMAVVRIGIPFGLSLEASVILPLVVAFLGIIWVYRRLPDRMGASRA